MKYWRARWIWIENSSERNSFVMFRKVFQIYKVPLSAILNISADSRYVLYLNGKHTGEGPARSFPWNQQYDSYDVKREIQVGKNVIAVLVNHFGESNFQYILGRGAFLCQLEIRTKDKDILVCTGRRWRTKYCDAYQRDTPYISSSQRGFCEQFDARKMPLGWAGLNFNDRRWKYAYEIGPVGISPWLNMNPRTVPFLTEEPVYPKHIIHHSLVEPPKDYCCLHLRPYFYPGDRTQNAFHYSGAVVILIKTRIKHLTSLRQYFGIKGEIYINGKRITLKEKHGFSETRVCLQKGDNLFTICFNEISDHPYLTFAVIDKDTKIKRIKNVLVTKGDPEEIKKISSCKTASGLKNTEIRFTPIQKKDISLVNVYVETVEQQKIKGQIKIENMHALSSDNGETAIIYPQKNDIEIIIDFGYEVVGLLKFDIEAQEGVILDFNGFEGIQDGEILWTKWLDNTLRYVTRDGFQSYRSIVRRGFRYLALTIRNLKSPLKIHRLALVLNTYPYIQRGRFRCSDELLNRIWDMCAWTLRLCSEDTFVDCPAYEQAFWIGDARGEALFHYALNGEPKLPERCLKLAAESLHRSPIIECSAPSGWANILPAWTFLWVVACKEYYIYTGDKKFLYDIYPAIHKNCEGIKSFINRQGLFEISAWNMLDWAPVDDGHRIVTHLNALAAYAFHNARYIADIVGGKKDASEWNACAKNLKSAINTELWDERNKAYIDSIHEDGTKSRVFSQQTNTMVYLCDCAPPKREKYLKQYVKKVPQKWVGIGTPFFMFFSFEALANLNDFSTIVAWIRKNWGFMLENDATTCWETFPSPINLPGSEGRWTRSHCHGWSSAPLFFLSSYQIGVRPLEPGFRKVLIAPEPVDISWVKGSFPTPYGEIQVDWEKKMSCFEIFVSLPMRVRAEVILPVSKSKYPKINIHGKILRKYSMNDRWKIDVPSGTQIKVSACKEM